METTDVSSGQSDDISREDLHESQLTALPLEDNEDDEDKVDISRIDKSKISHPKSIVNKFQHPKKVRMRVPPKPKVFTNGRNVTEANVKDLNKSKPYKYPTPYEELGHKIMTKAWRQNVMVQDLKVPIFKKQGMKEKLNNDLFNRLYVKVPPPDSTKTIVDLDHQYFKVVEGRPIHESFDRRDYIDTVREALRTKILIGYREDDISLINQNLVNEQKMIQQIQENYQIYVNAFEDLLFKDHMTAKQLLAEADAIGSEAYEKYEEFKRLSRKYGAMRAALYSSEDKWRNCKMYQKFLYNISPLQWRNEHPDQIKPDEEDLDEHFAEDQASEKGHSLSDMIGAMRQECVNEPPPELYFTDPGQLIDVFRFMEVQNLNYLLHAEELAIPLANIQNGMKYANKLFDVQVSELEQSIAELTNGIAWEENRAKELENLALTLINNDFKRLTMSDEILNLHVFVEDVYETRIGPNDANNSMLEMMKCIEEKYRHEVLSFDLVPAEQVAMLEGTCYIEQMKIMKLAEKAAKQYAELNTLTKQLSKAYAPRYQRAYGKEPKNRSQVVDPPVKVEPPPRDLTEEEEEYLEYFTDFCKYTDDPTRYGIDRSRTGKRSIPTGQVFTDEPVIVRTPGPAKYVTRIHGIEVLEKIMMSNT